MKIKNKLRAGFWFLFLMVIFFGAASLFYIREISNNSKIILKNNYQTLGFTREMRAVLDESDLPLSPIALTQFNKALREEENNITEKGEQQEVEKLKKYFSVLSNSSLPPSVQQQAVRASRITLRHIEELNMNAIVRKNIQAQKTVKNATIYLSFIGALTFLILFSFTFNFPGYIADPLNELTEGISEISNKNYKRRLNFEADDEFGKVARAFNQMARRLNEWETSNLAKVISEKLRIETIINQMQDAVIGLNERHEVIFTNRVAEKLLNIPAKEIVGKNTMELRNKNDLLRSILSKRNNEKPLKIYTDERESFFQLENYEIAVPVDHLNEDVPLFLAGESVGEVYILRNITRYKELDEAKTNFIATIAHQLRAPLNSIETSLKLLSDEKPGPITPDQKSVIEQISADNEQLLHTTSELLDLARLETENIPLHLTEVAPKDILDHALQKVKSEAEQKAINIDVEMDENMPAVQADTEKTSWVFGNFLSNALKASIAHSKIIISIKHIADFIEFSVHDFGKGIEEQYQKRLFDRYVQLPAELNGKFGTGLGWAVAKKIIEAQKGEIFVKSELGEGSTFGFRLHKAVVNG